MEHAAGPETPAYDGQYLTGGPTYSKSGVVGDAIELGKLPVPGCPTTLDKCRTRAYCACGRCGWVLFGHFSLLSFLFSFSLSLEEGPVQTEMMSRRAVKPKTTKQPIIGSFTLNIHGLFPFGGVVGWCDGAA